MLCFLETPVLRFALLPYYRRNQFHLTFFKTFENLNHDLTFRTLSFVYMHGLKERYTHPIKSGMKLKLELVLVFDRSRR